MGARFEPLPRVQTFGKVQPPAKPKPRRQPGRKQVNDDYARRGLARMIANAPRNHRMTQVEAALVEAAIKTTERKAA